MKLFSSKFSKSEQSILNSSQYDVIKLKTVAIFIDRDPLNEKNQMVLMQFPIVAGCAQSFVMALKCWLRHSEFLFEQRTKCRRRLKLRQYQRQTVFVAD